MNRWITLKLRIGLVLLFAGLALAPPLSAQQTDLVQRFDDPDLPGWERSPEVQVVDGRLHVPPRGFALYPGAWSSLNLSVCLQRPAQGAVAIGYRAGPAGAYIVTIESEHLTLGREGGGVGGELAQADIPPPSGQQWSSLQISVSDRDHTITLDGQLLVNATDPDPLPPGGLFFESSGPGVGRFDDLFVSSGPSSPTPASDEPTWIPLHGPPGDVHDLVVDPFNPARVLAATSRGLFVKPEADGEWNRLNTPPDLNGPWRVIALNPTEPHRLLAANADAPVAFWSDDEGETWFESSQLFGEGIAWSAFLFVPSDPPTVYAGTSARPPAEEFDPHTLATGIYVSYDGGQTWVPSNDALSWQANVTALAASPCSPHVLYAATSNLGLLKSDDGGRAWTTINQGLPEPPLALSLAVPPHRPNVVYAGLAHAGLYRSPDQGATWEPLRAGLEPDMPVTHITFDPDNPSLIYVADRSGGVYRSTDAGESWAPVGVGLGDGPITRLALSGDGQHLYAAMRNEGVWRLDLTGRPPAPPTAPALPLWGVLTPWLGALALPPALARLIHWRRPGGSGTSSRLDRALRRAPLITAMLLVTAATLVSALHARQYRAYEPLSLDALTRFEVNPYLIGVSVQALIVPVALVYLLGRTPLFRRIVSGEPNPHDPLRLFGALILLQLLALFYELFVLPTFPDYATLGLLIPVTAGLLGGWRTGLGVGLVTFFIVGLHTPAPLDQKWTVLQAVYQEGGWQEALDVARRHLLIESYLINPWALLPLWTGTMVGLLAHLPRGLRFTPASGFLLGVGLELGGIGLNIVAQPDVVHWIHMLIPNTLAFGLALAAVGLMIRSLQTETARRKAEAVRLALTRAELRALRAQINPHFLFNALNTIRYFVRTDPQTARRLLLNLSEIFQRALRSGEFIPLQDELGYVEAYLALEKARLDERLHIDWQIDQGQAGDWAEQPVPTLILQPLVENAVIHGVAKKPEGGRVQIAISPADGDLILRVEDDGPGIPPERLADIHQPDGEGAKAIGLRNVDSRLRALYGDAYGLAIESQVGVGTRAEIRIPLKR